MHRDDCVARGLDKTLPDERDYFPSYLLGFSSFRIDETKAIQRFFRLFIMLLHSLHQFDYSCYRSTAQFIYIYIRVWCVHCCSPDPFHEAKLIMFGVIFNFVSRSLCVFCVLFALYSHVRLYGSAKLQEIHLIHVLRQFSISRNMMRLVVNTNGPCFNAHRTHCTYTHILIFFAFVSQLHWISNYLQLRWAMDAGRWCWHTNCIQERAKQTTSQFWFACIDARCDSNRIWFGFSAASTRFNLNFYWFSWIPCSHTRALRSFARFMH